MYDTLWRWMEHAYQTALQNFDVQRIELVQRVEQSYELCEHQPQQAIDALQQGRDLAASLNESCWERVFELLLAEMYLYHMVDNNTALGYAARSVVETRKPAYEDCPARLPLINTLIHTYSVIDPYGYGDNIIDLIDYAQGDSHTDSITHYDLELSRAKILMVQGDAQAAEQIALRAQAHDSRFIVFNACIVLCHIMRETQQAQRGLSFAQTAIDLLDAAELSNPNQMLSLLWAYYTLFAQVAGYPKDAAAYFTRAAASETLLRIKPYYNVPDILSSYKQASGDYDSALTLRHQHIHEAHAAGSHYAHCMGRVRLCRLLGQMDAPDFDAELARARQSTNQLQKPDKIMGYIERIAQGDFTE